MDAAAEPEVIRIGSKAQESVTCAACQTVTPAGQFFSYRGKDGADVYLCAACRDRAEEALKAETERPNFVSAAVYGLLAGVAGGGAWYLVTILTKMEIGYVAIGVGWLIGVAVVYGAGQKRGLGLQLLSAGLTLFSIYAAKYF